MIFHSNPLQNTTSLTLHFPPMNEEIYIFCPDCRGKFEVVREDIVEGEVLECSLCGAEIEIVQEDPTKIKLLTEEEED